MHKKIMMVLLIFTCFSAQAVVRKSVANNETVNVSVSTKDPNVLSVKQDRIERFTASKGMLTSSLDSKRGVLILKPSMNSSEPFSVVVFTEKGNRYTLMMAPVAIPSQDIILVPESVGQEDAVMFERKSPYTEMVVSLMRHMVLNTYPEGYKRTFVEEKPKKINKGTISLKSIYQGNHLSGEILEYVHQVKEGTLLSASQFYTDEVMAVALNKEHVLAGDKVIVFRVVRNG